MDKKDGDGPKKTYQYTLNVGGYEIEVYDEEIDNEPYINMDDHIEVLRKAGIVKTLPEDHDLTICGPGPKCGTRNFNFPRTPISPDNIDYTIEKRPDNE